MVKATHVVNQSGETIKIVLTDSAGRNTSHHLKHNNYVAIPTIDGSVSLSVFIKERCQWKDQCEVTYTAEANTSFIVEKEDGNMQIYRSVLGDIWKKNLGY